MEHPIYKRLLAVECIRVELRTLMKINAKKIHDPEQWLAGNKQPDRSGYWMDDGEACDQCGAHNGQHYGNCPLATRENHVGRDFPGE